MLKNMVIFGVAIWVGSIAWAQVPRDGSRKNQKTRSSQVEAQPKTKPPLCNDSQGATPVEKQQPSPKPSDYSWRELYAPANIPNWILAGIGILGIGAALLTLRSINKQAVLMERQAKEMSYQNRNTIKSERAWVVVSVKENSPGEYIFTAKNEGRTPAKIQSAWCGNIWTPREAKLNIPPDEQTADLQLQNPPFLLPPGAQKLICIGSRTQIENMSAGGPGEQSRFARGFGEARFYGRIRYRNVLDSESSTMHETRWLYLLIPQPGTIPIPDPFHPEHNTYT
jgi:hypothetical protein